MWIGTVPACHTEDCNSADGRLVCTLEHPPYECAWDAGPKVAQHVIRASAVLADGTAINRTMTTRAVEYLDDVLDNLLNRGVVLNADLVLALANVDLVYVRLSALLCAADRLLPPERR